jgi:MYXO-CTERM domain-containing protein
VKNVAMSIVAVAGLSAAALAQTNNFTYELRLVSSQVAPNGEIALPASGGTVSFWLEARSRANSLGAGNSNFGVLRATTGPAGQQPAVISVTDSVADTRLGRGLTGGTGTGANAGTALTGRGPGFRAGGTTDSTVSPWHSATQNGTGGAAFPSGTGNAMGAFDSNGDRLYGFDSYTGGSRVGDSDPWITQFPAVPVGEFSGWNRMYAIDVLVSGNSERVINLNFSAYLSSGVRTQDLGGTWLMNITAASPASGSVTGSTSFRVVPTPGAAAVLGLAGLAAARRRRA